MMRKLKHLRSFSWIKIAVLVFILINTLFVQAQNAIPAKFDRSSSYAEPQDTIQWLSLDEAMVAFEKEKKKLIFEIYTKWCSWCKQMDEVTMMQTSVAQIVNRDYYPVKFDAECKTRVKFKEKEYEFVMRPGMGGLHELAAEFLDNKLSYPTIVFLDENLNIIQAIVGFKTPDEFEKIVSYFGTDEYKRTPWSLYRKRYRPAMVSPRE